MPNGIEVVPGLQLDIQLTWRKLSRTWMYFIIGSVMTGMITLMGVLAGEEFGILYLLFLSLFLDGASYDNS